MPLPPPPSRLLIVDRDREAIAAWLQQRRPHLQIRTAERTELQPQDLAWADAYLGFRPPAHLPLDGISWVHSSGAGVDPFIFRRPFPATTLLTRSDEPFGDQIGEWCLARALVFTQGLFALRDDQQAGVWMPRSATLVRRESLLVVGTGEVGQGVASAFASRGSTVHGVSRGGAQRSPFASVVPVRELASALPHATIVVLTLPLTEETFHLVDAALLRHCRGAVLMNVGRGSLIDEAAIVPALDAGQLRGAALDVFEEEPLPASSPLWSDPRVITSPHTAGVTTVAGAAGSFLRVLESLEQGREPALTVNVPRGY